MSTRISRVRDVISAPLSAFCEQYRVHQRQHARWVWKPQHPMRNFATVGYLATWPNTFHQHIRFQTLFAVSIARGCFTWSVPRLLGATPRWKSVLSQLFRTFVPFVCLNFMSRFERERLLFLFASPRLLDDEAVIRVGTLSLVQFVGLTVITVCLLEEAPKRGSREPTEQM